MEEHVAKVFSSDDGTITFYGKKDFPMGRATYTRKRGHKWEHTYRCITLCETAQVKTIYIHGWESDVENADYLRDRKKAIKLCGKKARSW